MNDSGAGALLPPSLVNTTIALNETGVANWGTCGGRGGCSYGPLSIRGSIVDGNVVDCAGGTSSIMSLGHNLDSDGTCNLTDPTDLPNTDPMLGPHQDNGGPTWTHALLPGSPAIDAIPQADCTYDDDGDPGTPEVRLFTDQRGVGRVHDIEGVGIGVCDIGAYEVTPCADGINNDTDAFTDLDDPGCKDATWGREDPQCQDGINNDPGQDALIDFDGGLSALGDVVSDPDPQCVGTPWKDRGGRGRHLRPRRLRAGPDPARPDVAPPAAEAAALAPSAVRETPCLLCGRSQHAPGSGLAPEGVPRAGVLVAVGGAQEKAVAPSSPACWNGPDWEEDRALSCGSRCVLGAPSP